MKISQHYLADEFAEDYEEGMLSRRDVLNEKIIYPNADHVFHNDTGSRYNPEAAKDAWERTLAWFEKYVRNS